MSHGPDLHSLVQNGVTYRVVVLVHGNILERSSWWEHMADFWRYVSQLLASSNGFVSKLGSSMQTSKHFFARFYISLLAFWLYGDTTAFDFPSP